MKKQRTRARQSDLYDHTIQVTNTNKPTSSDAILDHNQRLRNKHANEQHTQNIGLHARGEIHGIEIINIIRMVNTVNVYECQCVHFMGDFFSCLRKIHLSRTLIHCKL